MLNKKVNIVIKNKKEEKHAIVIMKEKLLHADRTKIRAFLLKKKVTHTQWI